MQKEIKKRKEILFKYEFYYLIMFAIASIPLMNDCLFQMEQGHDLFFHLMRIEGLAQGMENGQFPVRIQPAWYQGYGYGVSVFYGDIFLYIPAFLHMLGISLQGSYKLYIALCNVATSVVAGYSFKGIFKSEKIALFGSFLYTFSIYRIMNVYIRHAVGEYTAMIFLPLLVYAFYCIVFDAKSRKKGSFLLAIGMAGILQSHIISAEICVVALGIAVIVFIRKVWNKHVIVAFLKSVLMTVGLSLSFLVPFVDYMLHGTFNANVANSYKMGQDIGEHGVFLRQMFKIFYEATGSNLPKTAGTVGEMPLGVGCALGMAVVMWIVAEIYFAKKKHISNSWKILRMTAICSILVLWMSTVYFPWDFLRRSNKLLRYMIVNIQFPWRLFTLATLFLVMLWCILGIIGIENISSKVYRGGIILVSGLTLISAGYIVFSVFANGSEVYIHSVDDMNTSVASGEEYLPFATVSSVLVKDEVKGTDNLTWQNYQKNGLNITLDCSNTSEENGVLTMPLLYYEGYTCSSEELSVSIGENNLVAVCVPGHYSGLVEVYFREPIYWKIATILSVICYISLAGWMIMVWRSKHPTQPDS